MASIFTKLQKVINPYAGEEKEKRKEEVRGRKVRRNPRFHISKRQKFITSVLILSFSLFFSEYFLRASTLISAVLLAVLTDVLLFISLYGDLKDELSPQVFVLPFLCSLAFGLFYFLTPARLVSRLVLTTLFAIAVYSLFLSENIFLVGSQRTIALVNSARIVTFVISLMSFFFLSNIIFSFHIGIIPTVVLFGIFTIAFNYQALWVYTLEKKLFQNQEWVSIVSLCMVELASLLWFWPTTPTVLALFLTAAFYIFIGLSHMWLDKRLFRGVIWEYAWVGVFASVILLWFSHWTA